MFTSTAALNDSRSLTIGLGVQSVCSLELNLVRGFFFFFLHLQELGMLRVLSIMFLTVDLFLLVKASFVR